MSQLALTLSVTLFFLLISCLGLGIGRLVSGRNRLIKGCGSRPEQESCSLCGKRKRCSPEKESNDPPSDSQ